MKKVIPIILILILITGTLGYSQDFDDIKDTKYEEAVKLLAGYEVVNGFEDGTFRPDEPVTRGQMAKILTIVLGYRDYSKGMQSTFADTRNHWAEPYVEIVNSFDIVIGYDEDTFAPDDYISYSEAITMILRTVGYTDSSLPGDWPQDYMVKALDLGILEGINFTSREASRGDVALMVSRALKVPTVRINDADYPIEMEETLLDNIGYMEEDIEISENFIKNNNKNSRINLEEYKFHIGNLYYNTNEEIVYIGDLKTKEVKGEITSVSTKLVFLKDEAGNTRPYIISDAKIIFNNDIGRYTSLGDSQAKVIYINNSDDLEALGVLAKRVTRTTFATQTYQEGNTRYQGVEIPLEDGRAALEKVEVWGDAESIFDIRANDFLYLYESDRPHNDKNYLGIEVVRNTVEGVINSTSTNNTNLGYSVIDGQRYEHSEYYQYNDNLKPGYYTRVYLDRDGKILKYDLLEYLLAPDIYGLVVSKNSSISPNMPKLTVLNKNKETITFDIPLENDLVVEIDEFTILTYDINLKEGDMVVYSVEEDGSLKEIQKADTVTYSGIYSQNTGNLEDSGRVTEDTAVYYKKDNWEIISKQEIGEIIKGKLKINKATNEVEALVLEEGLRTNFENYIHAPVLDIEEVANGEDNTVYKFTVNIEGRERVLYSNDNSIDIEGVENNFIKINISENRVNSFEKVKPEVSEKSIEGIYKETLVKIDGTYWEFDQDTEVYTADKDSEGNYTFKGYLSVKDLKEGDVVNIFDLEGNFDGVIDHVIVIN